MFQSMWHCGWEIILLVTVVSIVKATPAAGSTPYNQAMFKASHNSYERDEDISTQLTWNPLTNSNGGCRSLELDIWRHSDEIENMFSVHHDDPNTGSTLSWWLKQLKAWHDSVPEKHDVVVVYLDIKSTDGHYEIFPLQIDWYLQQFFGQDIIFSPNNILQQGKDLVASIQATGWKTLEELRGKFIFVLTGNRMWKQYYADNMNSYGSYSNCFADLDYADDNSSVTPPTKGNIIFFNFHLYNDHYNTWQKTIPPFRVNNFITRGYVVNGADLWNNAMAAGVNAIATDKIQGSAWAVIGATPFALTP